MYNVTNTDHRHLCMPKSVYVVLPRAILLRFIEIPDFLPAKETNLIIKEAKAAGLERSEVVDPETQIKIEPTTPDTFREWDYNHDGTINKTEVSANRAETTFVCTILIEHILSSDRLYTVFD